MKKCLIIVMACCFAGLTASACETCTRKQSWLLRNATHGRGPDTRWDYLIVAIVALLVLLTLFYSIKWLLFPGEQSAHHIKNIVLNERP